MGLHHGTDSRASNSPLSSADRRPTDRRLPVFPKQGASLQDKVQLKERLEAVPGVAAVTHCRY
jgi:hypothetical protein